MLPDKIKEILVNDVTGFIIDLVLAIVILFVGLKMIKFIKKICRKSMDKTNRLDKAARSFIISVLGIAMTSALLVLVISIFNIQTISFAAVLGAAGLAVGLALQGSLSNFAGGFLILVLKPFRPGDFIELKGTMGSVEDMDIFYTKLKTYDNKKVVIPNSVIINNTLINYTEKNERRIDLNVGVSYESNVKHVVEVLSDVVKKNELVLDDPLPIIRLGEFRDSSLLFHVKVWCKTENYWNAYYCMMEDIKEALDLNNISIPYPQMDVHMKDVNVIR